jgi:hypothetical protein
VAGDDSQNTVSEYTCHCPHELIVSYSIWTNDHLIPVKVQDTPFTCTSCKMEDHPTFRCPFVNSLHWKGVKIDYDQRHRERVEAQQKAEDEANAEATTSGSDFRGASRGRRNGANRGGRGGKRRGGFQSSHNGKHK